MIPEEYDELPLVTLEEIPICMMCGKLLKGPIMATSNYCNRCLELIMVTKYQMDRKISK